LAAAYVVTAEEWFQSAQLNMRLIYLLRQSHYREAFQAQNVTPTGVVGNPGSELSTVISIRRLSYVLEQVTLFCSELKMLKLTMNSGASTTISIRRLFYVWNSQFRTRS